MGAKKPNIFNNENERFAKISDAMGNHWRLEILHQIEINGCNTSETLVKHLMLKQSTIHHHIKKLFDAELITREFNSRGYLLYLNTKTFEEYQSFIAKKTSFKDDNAA